MRVREASTCGAAAGGRGMRRGKPREGKRRREKAATAAVAAAAALLVAALAVAALMADAAAKRRRQQAERARWASLDQVDDVPLLDHLHHGNLLFDLLAHRLLRHLRHGQWLGKHRRATSRSALSSLRLLLVENLDRHLLSGLSVDCKLYPVDGRAWLSEDSRGLHRGGGRARAHLPNVPSPRVLPISYLPTRFTIGSSGCRGHSYSLPQLWNL